MDDSVILARLRQCAPHLMRGSLDPPDLASQTASRAVQPFLHSSRQTIHILYNGLSLSPQNCQFARGSGPPVNA